MSEAQKKFIESPASEHLEATGTVDNPYLELQDNQFGKGVYARTPLTAGTFLRLYRNDNVRFKVEIAQIPEPFRKYVAYVDQNHCNAPLDFNTMDIAWYVNHSNQPNVVPVDGEMYQVSRDIAAGEELFFDYNHLNEPLEQKESFYST